MNRSNAMIVKEKIDKYLQCARESDVDACLRLVRKCFSLSFDRDRKRKDDGAISTAVKSDNGESRWCHSMRTKIHSSVLSMRKTVSSSKTQSSEKHLLIDSK